MSTLDTLNAERQRLLGWQAEQLAVHEQNLQAAHAHAEARKAALADEAARLEAWHAERTAVHQAAVKTVNDHVGREVALLDAQIAAEQERLARPDNSA